MRTEQAYFCDYCDKVFIHRTDCMTHELEHQYGDLSEYLLLLDKDNKEIKISYNSNIAEEIVDEIMYVEWTDMKGILGYYAWMDFYGFSDYWFFKRMLDKESGRCIRSENTSWMEYDDFEKFTNTVKESIEYAQRHFTKVER